MEMTFPNYEEDIEDYVSIPAGEYVCRIAEVREGLTRDGSPRWGMRLEVAEGDYAGRTAGWDGLNWTERGLRRTKYVLDRLGIDTSGVVRLEPKNLVGLMIRATFQVEEREDPLTGHRLVSLSVPYVGYEAWEGEPASEPAAESGNEQRNEKQIELGAASGRMPDP